MPPAGDDRIRVLDSRSIYRGHVVDLHVERLRYPNGHEGAFEIIRHPGAAAVVPLDRDRSVVLIRQYRHAAGGWLLEIPAGKLEPDESPERCAARECAEEIALRPRTLRPLGSIFPTPGFVDETISLFLGTDLEATEGALEEDELIEVVRLPLAEVVAMASVGDLQDAKSAIGVLRSAYLLDRDAGREA